MKVIFMGTPDFSVAALDALVNEGHDILCVYSQPPRRAGRGKKERLTPVHARALELGLPMRHPVNFKEADDIAAFAGLGADVAVVVAYGLLLPQSILDAPTHGCLNIHASLLPRWRGAAPIHRAVMAGDAETGIGIMQMEAGLDTGPVRLELRTPIGDTETTGDLHDRLADLGGQGVCQVLSNLDGHPAVAQVEEGTTYAKKIDKAEARVDLTLPAAAVDRLIRGLSPFPGAWCDVDGDRVKLLRSQVVDGSGAPGTVLDGTTIACGDRAVEVLEIQPAGKRTMAQDVFLNGYALPKKLT